MKYLAILALLTSCASAQHAIETAQAHVDEAKALAKEAAAKRDQACAASLETLRAVSAVAPYACGLVEATAGAPEQAKATCAQRDKLPAAVRNVELACALVGSK
jgi:hypothetical protein